MREFESGATRDSNDDKLDYSGFLSPSAIKVFAAYMHKHRVQADGSLRASDNWKKGIPIPAYFESWIRHTIDFWDAYERGDLAACDDLACAIWFNMQGFLHERAKSAGAEACWKQNVAQEDFTFTPITAADLRACSWCGRLGGHSPECVVRDWVEKL